MKLKDLQLWDIITERNGTISVIFPEEKYKSICQCIVYGLIGVVYFK